MSLAPGRRGGSAPAARDRFLVARGLLYDPRSPCAFAPRDFTFDNL